MRTEQEVAMQQASSQTFERKKTTKSEGIPEDPNKKVKQAILFPSRNHDEILPIRLMEGSNNSNIAVEGELETTVNNNKNKNNSNKKKKAGELDSLLPQWGVRKRSRCNRLEQPPVKRGRARVREEDDSASKSNTGAGASRIETKAKDKAKKAVGSVSVNDDGGIASRIRNHNHALSKQRIVPGHSRDKDHEMSRSSNRRTNINIDNFKHTGGDSRRPSDTVRYGGGDSRNKLSGQSKRHVGGGNNNNDDGGHNDSVERQTSADCNSLLSHEWPRIILVLNRKEKEDDFLVFKGNKPPQRPKKRPKVVEKALLFCTPGYWLSDLSHGRYDVREKKNAKKNHGGLKAMESFESDSE